jgi:hypothetical protein
MKEFSNVGYIHLSGSVRRCVCGGGEGSRGPGPKCRLQLPSANPRLGFNQRQLRKLTFGVCC